MNLYYLNNSIKILKQLYLDQQHYVDTLRQRFDLSVTVLTAHAIVNNKILVFVSTTNQIYILDYYDY